MIKGNFVIGELLRLIPSKSFSSPSGFPSFDVRSLVETEQELDKKGEEANE